MGWDAPREPELCIENLGDKGKCDMPHLKKITCVCPWRYFVLSYSLPKNVCASILTSLLGKSADNRDVKKFFESFNEKPGISPYIQYDNVAYYSFRNNGISFLFKNDLLHAIFLFIQKDKRNSVNIKNLSR